MPTILSHPAVPLALGLALGSRVISGRLLLAGVVASVLPDADVAAFRLGVDYSHAFGHRGASHSLTFAALIAGIALVLAERLGAQPRAALLFIFLATASHGLLDMLTNGGLGIALLWPLTDDRLFFPVGVVEVSPLSLNRLFGPAGLKVAVSELIWIWLPATVIGACSYLIHRRPARL